MNDDGENSNSEEIDEMLDMRLSVSTKKSYKSSLRVFWKFLDKHKDLYPNIALPAQKIDLDQLTLKSAQKFLLKRQKKDKKSFRALSVLFVIHFVFHPPLALPALSSFF